MPSARSLSHQAVAELEQLTPLHIVGQRAGDFLGMARLLKPETLVVCEGGADAARLAEALGSRLISPERLDHHRRAWSHRSIDSLSDLAPAEPHGNVVLYAPSGDWERLLSSCSGHTLLANLVATTDHLDDKRQMRDVFATLGLAVLPSVVCERDDVLSGVFPPHLGWPLVVQSARGSSGHTTVLVRHLADALPALRALPGDEWLVTPYVRGPVLNVHAVVNDSATVIAPASVQLAGVPGITTHDAEYAGNDFGALAALEGVQPCIDWQVRRVASWLADEGLRGAIGMDFVWDGAHAWPLEVNPRLQGSTFLLGEVEQASGLLPTVARHVLEMARIETPPEPRRSARPMGAQLIIRWTGSESELPATRPGVYERTGGSVLRFRRPGESLLDCGPDQVLVHSVPPDPIARVERSAVIARISTWRPVTDGRRGVLSSYGRDLVSAARSLVGAPVASL